MQTSRPAPSPNSGCGLIPSAAGDEGTVYRLRSGYWPSERGSSATLFSGRGRRQDPMPLSSHKPPRDRPQVILRRGSRRMGPASWWLQASTTFGTLRRPTTSSPLVWMICTSWKQTRLYLLSWMAPCCMCLLRKPTSKASGSCTFLQPGPAGGHGVNTRSSSDNVRNTRNRVQASRLLKRSRNAARASISNAHTEEERMQSTSKNVGLLRIGPSRRGLTPLREMVT